MHAVFQKSLPHTPWADPVTRRLPGTLPLDPAMWLVTDDAYAQQMAVRDRLIAEREAEVHAVLPRAEEAAAELYRTVIGRLVALGFEVAEREALRPDGVRVALDPERPLRTLGRLVQEDFCLMMEGEDGEHVLAGAILCFPAGWRLAEKIGRPLTRIHRPVARYDTEAGRRVQRLFDALRPDRPLWRANAHWSGAPLFNPRSEADPRSIAPEASQWIRSERQCLVRLPVSGAVVFSIHTWLVRAEDLTPDQRRALAGHPVHHAP